MTPTFCMDCSELVVVALGSPDAEATGAGQAALPLHAPAGHCNFTARGQTLPPKGPKRLACALRGAVIHGIYAP